jgi:hypothetical protein
LWAKGIGAMNQPKSRTRWLKTLAWAVLAVGTIVALVVVFETSMIAQLDSFADYQKVNENPKGWFFFTLQEPGGAIAAGILILSAVGWWLLITLASRIEKSRQIK